MEAILQLGIQLILFLQSLGEWLVVPLQAISFMGNEEFYLIVAPIIYWCFDTRLGLRVGLALMVSGVFNTAFKFIFHHPRPYWIDTKVHAYSAESSFGAPSGHAQNAVVVWGRLAIGIQRKWFWGVAIAFMFLISLSRIYLGVHFLHDVLLGWLFGALLLWGLIALEKRLEPWLRKLRITELILWSFGASLVLILIGAASALYLALTQWTLPPAWVQQAALAAPDSEPIQPFALEGLISMAGTFFGLALGVILVNLRGGFDTRGKAWQLALRFLVGVAGAVAIRYGLGAIFPGDEALLAYFLRYVRYTLIGAWVTGFAPLLFIQMKLAEKKAG